jgi:hypothetical protein
MCFFLLAVCGFLGPMNWERGFDPGVFNGRFGLAALAQPYLLIFVCFVFACAFACWAWSYIMPVLLLAGHGSTQSLSE